MTPFASANITSSSRVFELQLAHDVGATRVDCANRDEELLADLLIRVTEGQQVQDVSLSVGQRLESW
jgi:hypothetical protein